MTSNFTLLPSVLDDRCERSVRSLLLRKQLLVSRDRSNSPSTSFESYHLSWPGSGLLRAMQIPSIFATQRDSKNDSTFGARREIRAPRFAMHRFSMDATELQSHWPEMRQTRTAKSVAKRVESRQ